ncbi:MAG: glycine cleavage system aminomethyltransferase GcvT [Methanomassiliicoccaceae archaeon]|jgi:aminomethyltransferase|nr:glycine cleavage system aminomethyltransferase GcvT [Methanomassiliicoccaceae archaeon]
MELKRTPFFDKHVKSGGRMVPFAGWEMPVQYTGIIEEHKAVRTSAGLFDVSHMGDLIVRGAGAEEFLENILTNNIALAVPGKGIYSHILNDDGKIIDDTIVYNLGSDNYLLVPNASTKDAVLEWLRSNIRDGVDVIDVSSRIACLAIQGPKAVEIAQRITDDVAGIKRFNAAYASLDDEAACGFLPDILPSDDRKGVTCLFARTGYTGEDGFEILVEECAAGTLWDALVREGGNGLTLAGLGCRDTLRLEKGMLLSGTDFNGEQTSLQTGPPWVVKFDHGFIGRGALEKQREREDHEVLVAMTTDGRNIPRHGYAICKNGKKIGTVTSGTMSPMLGRGIALGYVPLHLSSVGTELEIDVRGRSVKTSVVKLPFV